MRVSLGTIHTEWGYLVNQPVCRIASPSFVIVINTAYREPVGVRTANRHCSFEARQEGRVSSKGLRLP